MYKYKQYQNLATAQAGLGRTRSDSASQLEWRETWFRLIVPFTGLFLQMHYNKPWLHVDTPFQIHSALLPNHLIIFINNTYNKIN
jgi:hypothetical protein